MGWRKQPFFGVTLGDEVSRFRMIVPKIEYLKSMQIWIPENTRISKIKISSLLLSIFCLGEYVYVGGHCVM